MTEATFDIAERQSGIRKTVTVLVLIVLGVVGLAFNKFTKPRLLSAAELQDRGAILFERSRVVKPFELLSQNGETVNNTVLKGQWNLVFFGFTQCPDICPTTLATLTRVYGELTEKERKQLSVVLVTLDPERDTPEQLKPYIEYFHNDFTALTASDTSAINRIAHNFNIAHMKKILTEGEEKNYTIDHSGHIALVNPQGHYHGLIKPPFKTQPLVEVLRTVYRM